MTATIDILRGELERLFELDDMKQLSSDLLGIAPEDVGASTGKGAFARALVERCSADDALPALADAIVLVKRGMKEGVDLYVLSPEALDRFPEKGDHETTAFPELAAEGRLRAFRHTGLWLTVNTPKELRRADEYVSENPGWLA